MVEVGFISANSCKQKNELSVTILHYKLYLTRFEKLNINYTFYYPYKVFFILIVNVSGEDMVCLDGFIQLLKY